MDKIFRGSYTLLAIYEQVFIHIKTAYVLVL